MKFSKGKREYVTTTLNPGPGAYTGDILSARERNTSHKIGTSKRTTLIMS